ncbi:MAG: carbamoyltransferase HypF [Pseudolabrys sp.]
MIARVPEPTLGFEVRLRGRVQGVGFRPTVWRIARELGFAGEVLNDGEGVLLRVAGGERSVSLLLDRIARALPPLARIDRVERRGFCGTLPREFRIAESKGGGAHTQVSPDAAICPACAAELRDQSARRYRYPFTNCTHCGPRLTIMKAIPYDRANTSMAGFPLCAACRGEYGDPADRRFHAEPIACPECGPQAVLATLGNAALPPARGADDIERAARRVRDGAILAIKGLGGYHLACDGTNPQAVARLRRRKRRDAKPFALMARDLTAIRHYCEVDRQEERLLASVEAPIVLLRASGRARLPEAIAPGLDTLGFMLPMTPLHLLLMQDMENPLVMTSGNLSDEPPAIDDSDAFHHLAGIADYALTHNRAIANRVDDSIVRVMDGKARLLRRARGYAPAPIALPAGFETGPELLALGGELKATFCLVKDGEAVLSQHQGDLESAATYDDYCRHLALYRDLFQHAPQALVIDRHPDYLSSKLGRARAQEDGLPLVEVQHHHAHVAACLTESGRPREAPPVLGIALDGLGFGDNCTFWGGEFLLADYLGYEHLARLKPVAMPGGAQAVREPWRNLYAHLAAAFGRDWDRHLPAGLRRYFDGKPRALIDRMLAGGINAPLSSSCGRLFDAVAAALDLCRDRQAYEGEAATRLEALAASATEEATVYPFDLTPPPEGPLSLDPAPMWRALLRDLAQGTPTPQMARRFHAGLAQALAHTTQQLARGDGAPRFDTVALSGGCFHNRILLERTADRLRAAGFAILTHAEIPAGDGGLALGQAAVGLARLIKAKTNGKDTPCASAYPAALSP